MDACCDRALVGMCHLGVYSFSSLCGVSRVGVRGGESIVVVYGFDGVSVERASVFGFVQKESRFSKQTTKCLLSLSALLDFIAGTTLGSVVSCDEGFIPGPSPSGVRLLAKKLHWPLPLSKFRLVELP